MAIAPARPEQSFHPSLELQNCAAQLASLLELLHGHGFDAFDNLPRGHKDNILWLAADLAADVERLVNGGHHG